MEYSEKSFIVGVVGDTALQLLSPSFPGWGLQPYFELHGPLESVFIAGGMMYGFARALEAVTEPTVLVAFVYGVGLDFAFRGLRLFPSLDSYYDSLSVPLTALWGGLPMVMAFAF